MFLENHIGVLRQLKQEIPQKVTMLLQDAKKRADKRHAKRIANRQSACTSRARKKALVEEMTALNARLRRQALILSLLPDLVIVIDTEGTITFCSAQVERILQHNIDELIGANLTEIVDPGSREKISNLIQRLLRSKASQDTGAGDQKALRNDRQNVSLSVTKKKKSKLENQDDRNEDSAYETSGDGANTVTETSFPLSVIQVGQVNTAVRSSSDENNNSDASNDKQPSSLTGNSFAGNSGSDDPAEKQATNPSNTKTLSKEDTSISQSSDASNTSSRTDSSNAKNLLSANANLERNVRHHNKKIMKDQRAGFKDDVIGAAVTANNASARLSSLQHLRSAESSEEDSGYRESNDSREETSSSSDGDTPSRRNGRRKVIAPTCYVCLIRSDLSTLWCEVTSSLRTKDHDEELNDSSLLGDKRMQNSDESTQGKLVFEEEPTHESDPGEEKVKIVPQIKEILLCLRPIRDGDAMVDEGYRFKPQKIVTNIVSEDSRSSETTNTDRNAADSAEFVSAVNSWSASGNHQKRTAKDLKGKSAKKKRRSSDEDVDPAVVESLMSMSQNNLM